MIKPSRNEIKDIIRQKVPEITSEQQDEMAIPSYLHGNPAIRWLMWKRYESISRLVTKEKTENVLEFGCGIGLFLPELSCHARNIFAIDLFPQYAKRLCEMRQLNVTFVDSLSEIEDGSLDAIVAADVLEHVEDLEGVLRRFSDKLSPEGHLLVSGPTENIFYRMGRILAGFAGKGDYHHTNIDNIIETALSKNFIQTATVSLPFCCLPTLFKICALKKG